MNDIDQYKKKYKEYVLSYAEKQSEETLYECSELGKKLALRQCSVEDVVTLHQLCISELNGSLSHQQVIDSFDLLTEVTVQQALWLQREIELKSHAQDKISQQLLLEKSIISSFPDVLIKLSAELEVVDINEHFYRLFPNRQLEEKDEFIDLFENKNDIVHLIKTAEYSERRISRKMNLLSAKGSPISCEVTFVLLKNVNAKNDGFLCIIRDLREMLEVSAQLEFASQMIQDVIEAMPLRIYWKNIKQQYLGCNNAYLTDLGIDNEQLVLQRTNHQLPSDTAQIHLEPRIERQVIEQKIPFHELERTILLASGETICIKETIHPLKDLKGEIYGIICCYEDISELKSKELENQRLAENLNQSQRLDSVGRLAGSIAHDFNNMLSVILGYSQLMGKGASSSEQPDKFFDYLSRISAAADKAKLLTEKLLTFSRKQVLQPTPLDFKSYVSQTLDTYKSIIGEDITTTFESDRQYRVLADANQIDQVILNLLVNARDAILEKQSPEKKRIDFKLTDDVDKNYVRLHVKDTGVGIPEAITRKIFEPFFTTKDDIGTGLGLATVFRIITQNNGDITVNSEEGVGTEFIIRWPIDHSTLPLLPSDSHILKSKGDEKKDQAQLICIVEDEEPVRNLMESVIAAAGYNVVAVESGRMLFNYLDYSQLKPALLISDVILAQGENGKEVSQKFSERYPNIPVMFVSGYSSDLIAMRGIILEGVTYLKKPFDIDRLLVVVDDLLEQHAKANVD
jgi:nitrogen-specific signal transduction histidine kinase/CheY-like chemotaxis protein